jgi:hypothetical protein
MDIGARCAPPLPVLLRDLIDTETFRLGNVEIRAERELRFASGLQEEFMEGIVGARLGDVQRPVCVPKTSSVLISRRNRLTSAHHDRATMFRTGRLGRAIQVEEPA